jgi:hypothetical protein
LRSARLFNATPKSEERVPFRQGGAMILARILIPIIIGGLALIGYLLFVLRVTNRDDRK